MSTWTEAMGLRGECGVIRQQERWPVLPESGDAIIRSVDHLNNIVPTYAQELPSCVGHATANWIEVMLRLTHGRQILGNREQIDGDLIYHRGRELFFPDQPGGGLMLSQGFRAAIDLGILPPDTVVVAVPPTLRDISQALLTGPMVQGHVISKDWRFAHYSNGALPSRYKPNIFDGAHATLLIGVWVRDNVVMIPFLNSWGAQWGWNGVGQMTWAQWRDGYRWLFNEQDDVMRGDGPYTATLGPEWPTFDGWKQAVISK